MEQELKDRLIRFVCSVYDMEPLDEFGGETPLGEEALALMEVLADAGASDPTMPVLCEDCELEDAMPDSHICGECNDDRIVMQRVIDLME